MLSIVCQGNNDQNLQKPPSLLISPRSPQPQKSPKPHGIRSPLGPPQTPMSPGLSRSSRVQKTLHAVIDMMSVPPRYYVDTKMYVIYITSGVIIGLFILSTYNFVMMILTEKTYIYIPFYIFIPLGLLFFSFGILSVVGSLFFWIAASSSSFQTNSQYFSATKTPLPPEYSDYPMVVVQMPVYKESLAVIEKTYGYVKKAMDCYIEKGGKAKLFICDDGLQLIDPEDRLRFYTNNNINFIARPAENRKGIFKKASNLNYALHVAAKVTTSPLMPEVALLELWKEMNEEFIGYGDLSLPDECLLLLIDVDTKIPETCMHDVVGEFVENKALAYTQHFTQPFDEQNGNYWEKIISFFTSKIYIIGIGASCCMGDMAPIVGHNVFFRWSSLKKLTYEEDNRTKVWSENNVSEDFDVYLRLSLINEYGRFVMYTGNDFQEGVSLTFIDEVIKFRKFAYGACELVFNKIPAWITKGPINKTYIRYLRSRNIKWYHKLSLTMYMTTFFAMGSAFPLMLIEGVFSIVNPSIYDVYMLRTFDIMLTCVFVFGIISTSGCILFAWRQQKNPNLLKIVWDEVKWVPFIALFFNSVLFHITTAAYTYFFDLKIVWGATCKDAVDMNCFTALKVTILTYKREYILFTLLIAGYSVCLVYFDIDMYRGWAVMMYSIGHLVGPILLNPKIMSLSY